MAEQVSLNSDLELVRTVAAVEEEDTETAIFPVSDGKYAQFLQLQELLIGSSIIRSSKESASSSPPSMAMTNATGSSTDTGLVQHFKESETEESSQPYCEICAERKEKDQMFKVESCFHSFCSDCISKHVATRIQGSSRITDVRCPGMYCKAVLELDACSPVLPKPVFDQWAELLCRELIESTCRIFYCPFKDCSALSVYDKADGGGEIEDEGSVIRESECPFCHRLFCAQCNVPWHAGVRCEEIQRLNEDERSKEDIMLMELAGDQKWRRCPQCKFYVERTQGCSHIVCRCRFEFCYACGSPWTSDDAGCCCL